VNELDKGTEPRRETEEKWLAWSLAGLIFGGAVALLVMKAPKRPPAPSGTAAPLREALPADIAPAK